MVRSINLSQGNARTGHGITHQIQSHRLRASVAFVAILGLLLGSAGTATAATLPAAPTATQINGVVWLDADADGVNDVTENGLAGATVQLFDAANAQVGATITTTATGQYTFSSLTAVAGPYRVQVSMPTQYIVTVGGADNDVTVVTPAVGQATGVVPGTQIDAAGRPSWEAGLGRVGSPGYASGTAPFDAVCPAAGSDCSATDSVVRSQDSLIFNWSALASNTADGTWPGPLTNVVFEQTLAPSATAILGPIALPAGVCTGAGNPLNRVTVNADRSVTIVCNLGSYTTGQAKLLQVVVPVTGANGSTVTSTARTYGTNTVVSGGNATTLPTTTMLAVPSQLVVDPFTITALFAYDLVTEIFPETGVGSTGASTFVDVDNNPATPAVRGVNFTVGVGVFSRSRNNEQIALPLNVKLNLFATTGSQTAPFSGPPIQWYTTSSACSTSAQTGLPVTGNTNQSLNGTCTLTRANPADPTSAYTMSLASMKFFDFPTAFSPSLAPVPANTDFVGTYAVPVFVPWSELDRLDGIIGNGAAGSTSFLDAWVSDFNPVSVSGVTNNNGTGVKEPGYCSSSTDPYSVADITTAAFCQDAIGLVTQRTFPGLSRNYDNVQVPNSAPALSSGGYFWKGLFDTGPSWNNGATVVPCLPGGYCQGLEQNNVFISNRGSALVIPNKVYTVKFETNLSGEVPMYNPQYCDVFDNQTQRLVPATAAYPTAPANTWGWVSSITNTPADPKNTAADYKFQFGHFDLTGINQVSGPVNPNGRYPGTWTAMQTVSTACVTTTPTGGWQSDPTLVPGGVDAVNAVLVTRVDPTVRFVTDGTYSGSDTTHFQFLLQARDTYNGGPYTGQPIVTGTVLPDMFSDRVNRDLGYTDLVNPTAYTPSPVGETTETNANRTGSRVTIARAVVAIKARTVTVGGVGTAPAAIDVNGNGSLGLPVVWQVLPQLVSLTGQPESVSNVVMRFEVPAGLTYDPGCSAVAGGTPPAQILTNTPSAGLTTLQWTVPTMQSSAVGTYLLPDYLVCTQSSLLAASGSSYMATVSTLLNTQALNGSSDVHVVTLTSPAQLNISKSVDAAQALLNGTQRYTIGARNSSSSFAFTGLQFIEVLPFVGDGTSGVGANRDPASFYQGTLALTGVPTAVWPGVAGTPAAPVTYTYTADAPAAVSQNPNVVSNTWCSFNGTSFTVVVGSGACPTSLATVTAFRALLGASLEIASSTKASVSFSFTVLANGNSAGNVYSDRAVASANELVAPVTSALIPLLSNQTTVRVQAFSVGDLIFNDVNKDGRYTSGIDLPVPSGTQVQLWDAGPDGVVGGGDDTLMFTRTTDASGRYLFPLVPVEWNSRVPRVFVKVPASEFATGGALARWTVTTPQGPVNQNQNLSQDGVAGVGGERVGGVVTQVYTLSYTTAGNFFIGSQPLGDNTLGLTIPAGIGDDFTNLTLDIGVVPPPLVSIGNRVWLDEDRDGQQSVGEPGVAGVTVALYDATDTTLVASTTTDSLGFYVFTNLMSETGYVVRFTAPSGDRFTTQTTGPAATDSDPNVTTGRVSVTTPASGSNSSTAALVDDPTIDAGLVRVDLTLDKELVASGPYFAGQTIHFTLTPHNVGTTDALPGWSVTDVPAAGLTITALQGSAGGSSIYTCVLGTLTCTAAGTALPAGATAETIDVTATIGASFVGSERNVAYIAPGAGEVTEVNPLVVPTSGTDTGLSSTNNDAQAFVSVDSLVSIGDYVWLDVNRDGQQDAAEPGIAGMTVNLYLASDASTVIATATTNPAGYYYFKDLTPDRQYIVEFVKPTSSDSFTVALTGATSTDSDADVVTGRVAVTAPSSGSNQITAGNADDPTIDAGLVSVDLTLDKDVTSSGPYFVGDTVTYSLTPHNIGVTDALKGWSVTELPAAGLTITGLVGAAGGSSIYTCVLATLTCTATDTILGAGRTAERINVTATITTSTPGPARNVAYVSPGEGEVTEANPLVVPTADTDTSQSATNNDAQAFITIDSLVSIGDFVWLDSNVNGLQDAAEPGIAGVTVNLYLAADPATIIATTTTNPDGYYFFKDLTPDGQYIVEFVKPNSTLDFSTVGDGTHPTTDSDANVTTGRVNVTAPSSGFNATDPNTTDDSTIDAGMHAVPTLPLPPKLGFTGMVINNLVLTLGFTLPLAGIALLAVAWYLRRKPTTPAPVSGPKELTTGS